MKNSKKLVTLVLLLAFTVGVFTQTQPANAAQIMAANTADIATKLTISNGTASCYGETVAIHPESSLMATMTLQKIVNNKATTIKIWKASTALPYVDLRRTYTVSKGKYKLTWTSTAYYKGTTETISRYSTATY